MGLTLLTSSAVAESNLGKNADLEGCTRMATEYLKEYVFGKGNLNESDVKDRPELIKPLLDKISSEYAHFEFTEKMTCLNNGAKQAKAATKLYRI